jgi:twitching motility protein PilT
MLQMRASDLHVTANLRPAVRVDGELIDLQEFSPLSEENVRDIAYSVINETQKGKFERERELDFAFSLPGKSRFRGNLMVQKQTIAMNLRAVPEAPAANWFQLGLPPIVEELCQKPRGLILITGATGSGKSTTLSAMIDYINQNYRKHIVTIEDPIEVVHPKKMGVVRQRELGTDTNSFQAALKHVLRQDPDVIMVGEMRDLETIQLTLTAAETGHLVLATLHTRSAASSIDRIIDVFPPHQQQQVRLQLGSNLQAVVSQMLLPRANGQGRVVACEIMLANSAAKNLIREAKTHQLGSLIQSAHGQGMQTIEQCLKKLVDTGAITAELAMAECNEPNEMKLMLQQGRR